MIITALITPYLKNGRVDFKKFKELLKMQEDNGVHGIVLFGSTGEGMLLSKREKMKMASIAKKKCNLKVILNIGSNNTKKTLSEIKLFSKYGPYAFLLITPYYLNPSEEGIFKHYETCSNHSKVPIIIYNVPSRTNIDISIELIERLMKLKNIIGIKEASKNLYKLKILKDKIIENFLFLLGNDEMFVRKEISSDGIISVLSNIIPKAFVENDYERIEKYLALTKLGGNPEVIKEIMNQLKFDVGGVRLPLVGLSEEKRKMISLRIKEGL